MTCVYKKNPDSVLDFGINWEDWLAGDTLATSVWESSSTDLVVDSSSFSLTQALVWLSGGLTGQHYTVVNTVTTAAGRTDKRYITIICQDVSSINYLIPYVRLRVGDTNAATYRYGDDWLQTALVAAVEQSGRWLNYRYLLDETNSVYRNPAETNWLFDEATYGVFQPGDDQIIVLLAAILVLEGSLENSAWNIASWRDAEISFSNLEQARTRGSILDRLWTELTTTLRPPNKRLARSKKQSLPGYKDNLWEVGS